MDQARGLRMNQFERICLRWKEKKLTQAEAGEQLEMSEGTFRSSQALMKSTGQLVYY